MEGSERRPGGPFIAVHFRELTKNMLWLTCNASNVLWSFLNMSDSRATNKSLLFKQKSAGVTWCEPSKYLMRSQVLTCLSKILQILMSNILGHIAMAPQMLNLWFALRTKLNVHLPSQPQYLIVVNWSFNLWNGCKFGIHQTKELFRGPKIN